MPELHKLSPPPGVLQDRGFKVGLVTDGRMSGASGKVPAAIHISPEAADQGPLARVQEGDIIRLDAEAGRLEAMVDAESWNARASAVPDLSRHRAGLDRELFAQFRAGVTGAEQGAATNFFDPGVCDRHEPAARTATSPSASDPRPDC